MKQTAVDLMYERAISVLPMGSIDARQKLKETYQQAKEKEKEQICDAFYFGVKVDEFTIDNPYTEAEQYYKENYSK
jgi:hypothetical protein